MKIQLLLAALVGALALTLGAYVRNPALFSPNATQSTPIKMPNMNFASLDGKAASLQAWQGKVIVLNFWATWCPPCREEMPEFSRASQALKDKAVQFAGIGIDTPDNIAEFQKNKPVAYPLFISSYETLKQTAPLGNQSLSLPFTIIIDPQGTVVFAHQGKLNEAELMQHLSPLLTTPQP